MPKNVFANLKMTHFFGGNLVSDESSRPVQPSRQPLNLRGTATPRKLGPMQRRMFTMRTPSTLTQDGLEESDGESEQLSMLDIIQMQSLQSQED